MIQSASRAKPRLVPVPADDPALSLSRTQVHRGSPLPTKLYHPHPRRPGQRPPASTMAPETTDELRFHTGSRWVQHNPRAECRIEPFFGSRRRRWRARRPALRWDARPARARLRAGTETADQFRSLRHGRAARGAIFPGIHCPARGHRGQTALRASLRDGFAVRTRRPLAKIRHLRGRRGRAGRPVESCSTSRQPPGANR
jgi:hypothetical protein